MALPNTYTRRTRTTPDDQVDVYTYDNVPKRLKVQTVQLIGAGIGPYYNAFGNFAPGQPCYDLIVKLLRREEGVHELVAGGKRSKPDDELLAWLEHTDNIGSWLDGVEMSLRMIDRMVRPRWGDFSDSASEKPEDVLTEFNERCREAGLGYQYVDGSIIRIDSELIHKEVVLPALKILRNPIFEAADKEYRDAHAAFRRGDLKDCLVGCSRAFESVLKVIGGKRGWTFQQSDTANKLVQAAVAGGFLATHHQTALNHLQGLLTSAVPSVRNNSGGHGDGAAPKEVPNELAAFQLHQTAAVILYLAEHDASLP